MRPLLILIGGEAWSAKSTVAQRLFLRLNECAWLDGDDVWRVNPFSVDDPRLRLSDLNMAYVLRTYLEASFHYVDLSSVVLTRRRITERILSMLSDVPCNLLSFTLLCDDAALTERALQPDGVAEPEFIVVEEARQRTDTIQIDTAGRSPDEVVEEMLEHIRAALERPGARVTTRSQGLHSRGRARMCALDALERLYAVTALTFLTVLCVHFTVRRRRLDLIMRYGWIVYALSLPAAGISLVLLNAGRDSSLWLGGSLYLVWATFGFIVEYVLRITDWRTTVRWEILVPYVLLYLATCMFYWWPLWPVCRPLWYMATALYVVQTVLNVRSHAPARGAGSTGGPDT